jgi:hypothetical protein
MKDNSVAKLGGTCAILVGVSYLVVGVTFLMLPVEQQAPSASAVAEFLESVAADSNVLQIQSWAFALGALLAIAVVTAVSDLVRSANEGLVRWTSTLAIIGFTVVALLFLITQDHLPKLAAAYVQADRSTQLALEGAGFMNIDPDSWMGFGTVGLWFLVVNWLAMSGGQLPRSLTYIGLATGIAYALVVAGNVLSSTVLISIAAGLGGGILGPIWYIWTGVILRRTSTQVS